MEENRFFKFVWRFNGLALMIAGILAIGLLLVAGFIAVWLGASISVSILFTFAIMMLISLFTSMLIRKPEPERP